MDKISAPELMGLAIIIAIILFVNWRTHKKQDTQLTAFNAEFHQFKTDINKAGSLSILKSYRWAVSVFKSQYRKKIAEETLNDACGKLYAEIDNRIARMEVVKQIETNLANQNQYKHGKGNPGRITD